MQGNLLDRVHHEAMTRAVADWGAACPANGGEMKHDIDITTKHNYSTDVPDKFRVEGWHEVGRSDGHISMTVPDSVTGREFVLSSHLTRAQLKALHQIIGAMLTDWDALGRS